MGQSPKVTACSPVLHLSKSESPKLQVLHRGGSEGSIGLTLGVPELSVLDAQGTWAGMKVSLIPVHVKKGWEGIKRTLEEHFMMGGVSPVISTPR